jgi:hypothetical protein
MHKDQRLRHFVFSEWNLLCKASGHGRPDEQERQSETEKYFQACFAGQVEMYILFFNQNENPSREVALCGCHRAALGPWLCGAGILARPTSAADCHIRGAIAGKPAFFRAQAGFTQQQF